MVRGMRAISASRRESSRWPARRAMLEELTPAASEPDARPEIALLLLGLDHVIEHSGQIELGATQRRLCMYNLRFLKALNSDSRTFLLRHATSLLWKNVPSLMCLTFAFVNRG